MAPNEQPATLASFQGFMNDVIINLAEHYHSEPYFSPSDFNELRRLIEFPAYVPYDAEMANPLPEGQLVLTWE